MVKLVHANYICDYLSIVQQARLSKCYLMVIVTPYAPPELVCLQVTVEAGSTTTDVLDETETNQDCTTGIALIRAQRRVIVIKIKRSCALSYLPILTVVTTLMTVRP